MITLDALNAADRAGFVQALGELFENAPWVAEQAFGRRPFATVADLHAAMLDAVRAAPEAGQLRFLNGHPELGTAADMGDHSVAEQAGLGLQQQGGATAERLATMNAAYRARFGFPFIICVRRHTRASILRSLERRLAADPAAERAAALEEVARITRLRIVAAVQGPGLPRTGGGLSTHVLDTARGRPAAGVAVELFVLEPEGPLPLASGVTDADGRVPGGLIPDGEPLRIGAYEIRFHVGPYFAAAGLALADPAYLDMVPVRIALAEAEAHYHVPLLVSPWTYTTYRGS